MDNINKNLHDIVDTIEDDCKSKKGKESSLLLKQKMCKTHDLIKQYNEKLREIDCLKSDLKVTKKDGKHMQINYQSILDETRKLELQIVHDKLENEKLSNKLKEYEVNTAADKRTIQQLTYKIQDLENNCSSKIMEYDLQKSVFKDKIRDLEHELQKSKVMYKRKERKIISNNSDTAKLNMETKSSSDIGINVSLDAKSEVQDKSIMTDEFYNIKNDPYPLFCAKCESHLPAAITPEKICKTMCTYPELIEKNFLPPSETILSSPCLIPSTCPDSTNKNEDSILSRSLSTSCLSLCSQYNDSIVENCKSQSISATIQNYENNELRNANVATHTSIATKVPSNNLNSISATCASSHSIDCTKKDFYSNNLLFEHSASLEKMKEQIRSLESRINKLKKLKEKSDINSCHCSMNYNNNALLNSGLFTIICQGIAEYYNKKKETCSKNEQNINSEKDKKVRLKRRRLNKFSEDKNASLWETEDLDESCVRDTLYNKSEVTTKTTVCDTLQSKREICINKSNVMPNANVPSKFLNDNDEYDRESIFCKENSLNSAEVASVEDTLTASHLSTDKLYNSIEEISNNSLSEDDMKTIDTNDQIKMKVSSCNSDISIDNADDRISDIIPEGNGIKRKSQNKNKFGDRLFKKIRNLKRKVQANSHVNKEESIELYPDDYKPIKKLRIAHAPKMSVLQSSNNQEDFTHCIIKNISLETFQRKHNQRLNIQICKHNSLTENKEDCTISEKCNKRNAENEHNKTNNIDDRRCTRKIYEKNLVSTNSENCFQNNDNSALSIMDIECASTVSDKRDDVSIESTSKENTLIEGIADERSNNCDELESHNNVSDNVANDVMFEKSVPVKTQVIQSESSALCKDSKSDTYKFTENLQVKAADAIEKGTTPSIELQYIPNVTRESSLNNDHELPKNMDINDVMSNQSIVKEATEYESHNNSDVSNEASEQFLERDNEIIVHNYIDVHKSVDQTKNTLGKQEMHVNDEITEIQAIEIREENACTNQQDKRMELINHTSHDDVEQLQTPMSLLNKYINNKYINYKLLQKKIYYRKITDKFVKKQLKRLLNNAWEDSSVHYDIIQKLENTRCGSRIIAKCIVEFLLESKHDEPLDKSFTPPAPLMTLFEQKLTALLVDLEVSKPTVVYYVQVAIEYKLFKLNSEAKAHVNSFTRIYLILSRIQKDRERVRIMCCNALYCMNLMSINVLYTIFTSWPEVLPNAEINKEILPKCIAFLIATQHIEKCNVSEKLLKKLIALKNLISIFYKYSYTIEARNDIVKEFMTLLKAKRCNGLDTAIILVAKKGGSSWTYKDIIQSDLLPMIINYEHPCIYSAFSLLGRLMRAFPLKDEDNIVQEITEQLCDLIQSGEGTHDQQEGVISALLSLSRHNFDVIVSSILKWTPNKSLRWTVIAQLQAFINTRNTKFWKNYLQHMESK